MDIDLESTAKQMSLNDVCFATATTGIVGASMLAAMQGLVDQMNQDMLEIGIERASAALPAFFGAVTHKQIKIPGHDENVFREEPLTILALRITPELLASIIDLEGLFMHLEKMAAADPTIDQSESGTSHRDFSKKDRWNKYEELRRRMAEQEDSDD